MLVTTSDECIRDELWLCFVFQAFQDRPHWKAQGLGVLDAHVRRRVRAIIVRRGAWLDVRFGEELPTCSTTGLGAIWPKPEWQLSATEMEKEPFPFS